MALAAFLRTLSVLVANTTCAVGSVEVLEVVNVLRMKLVATTDRGKTCYLDGYVVLQILQSYWWLSCFCACGLCYKVFQNVPRYLSS